MCFLLQNQRTGGQNRRGWGLAQVWGEWSEKDRRMNMVQIMYINAEMVPVDTVPGIGGGKMEEFSGGDEFKYDIFDTL
jgi:hypothetical protein